MYSALTYFFAMGPKEVIAYDEKGKEIVRVPLVEPLQSRPHKDERLEVVRQDIP